MDARILHELKREHRTPIPECARRLAVVKSTIGFKASQFHNSTRRSHTQGSSQKVDLSIRNASTSRGVESRPEAKLRVRDV